jgi:activating signal cointegrator 1
MQTGEQLREARHFRLGPETQAMNLFDQHEGEIKAIALHQYLASLVSIGAKPLETRSFRIKWRGPLAIHAAKTIPKYFDKNAKYTLRDHYHASPVTRRLLEKHFGIRRFDELCMLPGGGIICLVDLVDCVQIGIDNFMADDVLLPAVLRPYIKTGWREFGIYNRGRYLWLLKDVQRLNQIVPCKGYQGLWTLDAETREKLREQLPSMNVAATSRSLRASAK